MSTERIKKNYAFLHDIATPMSIIGLMLKRLAALEQDASKTSEEVSQKLPLLTKALTAMEKLEVLHANQKMQIAEWEMQDKSKESSNV